MARVLDSVVSTDTARRDEAETDCMLAMEAAAAVARDMAGRLDQRQLLVSGPAYE
jgi:hypothetical protein